MKRITVVALSLLLIFIFPFYSYAELYEYDMNDDENAVVKDELSQLYEALPESVRDKIVPVDENNYNDIANKYSFSFFAEHFKKSIQETIPDFLQLLTISASMIILICIVKRFNCAMGATELSPAMNMCSGLATALAIYNLNVPLISAAGAFLDFLSKTMLLIVPIMEGIYVAGGNYTLSMVTATSINLMIAFTENIFANFLSPAVSVLFLFSTLTAVTDNRAIGFLTRTLRNIVTTGIILIMTLMTFALTLQCKAAASADSFALRTIRFALGSYIPFVGGAVSETFDILKGSVSAIKSMSGITCIVIIILIAAIPLISLMLSGFAMHLSSNLAGMLESDSEERLFAEYSSNYSLLIAIMLSSVIMYIIALAQFCNFEIAG